MKNMRVLVLGQTGQVARALSAISPAWTFAGRDTADLTKTEDLEGCLAARKWDAVINAAGYTAVDRAESEPDLAHAVNAVAPGIIAHRCAAMNVPFIHLSTDYVFDGKKSGPYVEDDEVSPLNVYGASKAEGERAVLTSGGKNLIIRTSWVYAPEGRNFVRTMLKLGRERDEIQVVNDQTGTPTFAVDIAQGIAGLLPGFIGGTARNTGIFHMTGSGQGTWFEFAEEIFRLAALSGMKAPRILPISTEDYKTPARRPANSRLDCTKLETVYGIKLPRWEESLQRCFGEMTLI